jgi:hypothetical protein
VLQTRSSLRDIPSRSGKLALQPLFATQDYCCVTHDHRSGTFQSRSGKLTLQPLFAPQDFCCYTARKEVYK